MSVACARSSNMKLRGATVLVTRPVHQAGSISAAIEQAGGSAIRFPTLTIVECISPDTRRILEQDIASFDIALFVSANAVWHGVPVVLEKGVWPETLKIGVVGPGSAAALQGHGLSVHISPAGEAGSLGLLATSELQACSVGGRHIVIFRGRGGLSVLGDELSARGAVVSYAEVYERQIPDQDAAALNARGRKGEIDIIVVTSAEALRNLFTLLGDTGKEWLRGTPFLVVSERIAQATSEFDLRHSPLVARGSSDPEVLEALVQWREA